MAFFWQTLNQKSGITGFYNQHIIMLIPFGHECLIKEAIFVLDNYLQGIRKPLTDERPGPTVFRVCCLSGKALESCWLFLFLRAESAWKNEADSQKACGQDRHPELWPWGSRGYNPPGRGIPEELLPGRPPFRFK
jgi:hypothetical protein